jgi:hypothetical protein
MINKNSIYLLVVEGDLENRPPASLVNVFQKEVAIFNNERRGA